MVSSSKALTKAPAFLTVVHLVHLSISSVNIMFFSLSRTFHSSPLTAGENPSPSASLPSLHYLVPTDQPHLLLLTCSDQTSSFSFPQTLWAFLFLCLHSLGRSNREPVLKSKVDHVPVSPFTCCVNLGKSLNLSELYILISYAHIKSA